MVYKHDKSNAREEGEGNYDVGFGDEFELKDKVDVASNDKVKGERDIDVSFASVAECSSSLRTDKSRTRWGGNIITTFAQLTTATNLKQFLSFPITKLLMTRISILLLATFLLSFLSTKSIP